MGWIPLDATVSGQTYALGDVVELDGKHFVGCVFGEGCVLRYRGGEVFSIQQSAFSSQIRVEFATPDLLHSALLVAQLQTLYAQTEDGGGLEVGMVDEERLSANVYYEGTA